MTTTQTQHDKIKTQVIKWWVRTWQPEGLKVEEASWLLKRSPTGVLCTVHLETCLSQFTCRVVRARARAALTRMKWNSKSDASLPAELI